MAFPFICFSPVPVVLCTRCWTKVRLAIIQAIMIDMVAELSIPNLNYLSVHLDNHLPSPSDANNSLSVEGMSAVNSIPFVCTYPLIIVRVHNGVFTLSQWYPPEGIAEPKAPIQ